MAKANTDAKWVNLDPDTLEESLRTPYDLMKQAYKEYKALRAAFEQDMNDAAGLPDGKRMVFGYNFGKLSVAIVDDDRKPAKPKQASMTLADFIAAQSAAGRNA